MKKIITNIIRILFFALFVFLILNGKMTLWFALYGGSLVLALLFGRIYCGYVCPMNTLMIPTEWLAKKMNWQRDKTPKILASGKFVWLSLIGSIGIMLLGKRVLKINIPILLIWLALSVIITLRYKPAVFHNLICPFGIFQKFFGKFAFFSTRVVSEKCIGCKLCEKVCPSDSIVVKKEDKKAEVNTSLCLQCSNCQEICPTEAIEYSKEIKVVDPESF